MAALCAAACGARHVYHTVRRGETLARIGAAYGVPYQTIAAANDLSDPSRIYVGQQLRIPGADRAIALSSGAAFALAEPLRRAGRRERPRDAPRLTWPIASGAVTSGYGPRNGTHHDGIDIAAPAGAAVRAAADGEVVYSDALPGYGNVIILRHGRGYLTLYAHNETHHARDGERVRRGQLIAAVGRTGRTTAPNLHFEVRKANVAYDPLHFLPPGEEVGVALRIDRAAESLTEAGGG